MVNVEMIKNEQAIFNESWLLLKTFFGISQDDDESWELLIEKADSICRKFKNTDCEVFASKLVLSIISRIEQKSKEMR